MQTVQQKRDDPSEAEREDKRVDLEENDEEFWQRVGKEVEMDCRDKMMKKNGIFLFLNIQTNENVCSLEYSQYEFQLKRKEKCSLDLLLEPTSDFDDHFLATNHILLHPS